MLVHTWKVYSTQWFKEESLNSKYGAAKIKDGEPACVVLKLAPTVFEWRSEVSKVTGALCINTTSREKKPHKDTNRQPFSVWATDQVQQYLIKRGPIVCSPH